MWLAKLHHEGRTAERHRIETDGTLRTSEDAPVDILIADVSSTGCLFVCLEALEVGASLSIGFAGLGRLEARIVRAEASRYGAEFTTPLAASALAQAVSEPRDAVIPLSASQSDASPTESEVAAEERWPIRQRLLSMVALALAFWGLLLALRLHL